MSVTEIENFAQFEAVKQNGVVVADFYATWCGPCKMISPKFIALAKQHTDKKFIKIDIDKVQEAGIKYNISSMPTFILFKFGKEVDRLQGASHSGLVELVKK